MFEKRRTDFGDARFTLLKELKAEGTLFPGGILVGRALDLPAAKSRRLRHGEGDMRVERLDGAGDIDLRHCRPSSLLFYGSDRSQDHVAVIAPTRSGKTSGVIIPNCLTYEGSIVVVDPKGEVAEASAAFRESKMRQEVHVIDPKGMSGHPASSIDALALVDRKNPLLGCTNIAQILNPEPAQNDPYWTQEAVFIMAGFLGHIVTSPKLPQDLRRLGMLRHCIMQEGAVREHLLDMMEESDHQFIRYAAETLRYMPEKQYEGVKANMRIATNFLEDPDLCRALDGGRLDLADLKKKRVSLYIVPRIDILRNFPAFVRLIIESILLVFEQERAPATPSPLLLVDEFGNLGKMDVLARSLTIAGGFGLRVAIVLQDLGAVQAIYGHHQLGSMLDNCAYKVWMAPAGTTITPHLSRELGNTTITTRTKSAKPYSPSGFSQTFDGFANLMMDDDAKKHYNDFRQGEEMIKKGLWGLNPWRWQTSTQAHGTPLMSPDQLNVLPPEFVVITRGNGNPILAHRVKWYEDVEFAAARAFSGKSASAKSPKLQQASSTPPRYRKIDKRDWGF